MLAFNSVIIGTKQPQLLATFYEKVLGKPPEVVDNENGFWGWQVGKTYMGILDHSEMRGNAKDPGRIMINLETNQVKDEFTRIRAFGGLEIRAPYQLGDGWIATLADPDGNYFQLMTPMETLISP